LAVQRNHWLSERVSSNVVYPVIMSRPLVAGFPSWRSHAKAFGVGAVLALLGLGVYLQWGPSSSASADLPSVTVYKSPTCGCCGDWVTHLRDNGFPVTVESRANLRPVKQQLGVPDDLASCHTAVVENYVVEGHVPAEQVKRLLRETPELHGISVPGMPVGSPGMERGDRVQPYDVVGFTANGDTTVVAQYGS
jgi:hypothetical protein